MNQSYVLAFTFYKFQCCGCNATYYGKTKRYFKVRICEHLEISALTGKKNEGDDDFAIKKHLLFCNHTPDFGDFSVLNTNDNDFKVTFMESFLINRRTKIILFTSNNLYFLQSKNVLIWFFLQLFFVKRSKNFFNITIANNICPWHSIFNFFNPKNVFRSIWNVTFCRNVFIF